MKKKRFKIGTFIAPVVIPAILTLGSYLSLNFSGAIGAFFLAFMPGVSLAVATVLGVALSIVCAVVIGVAVCAVLSEIIHRLWFGTELDQTIEEKALTLAQEQSSKFLEEINATEKEKSAPQAKPQKTPLDSTTRKLQNAAQKVAKATPPEAQDHYLLPAYENDLKNAEKDYARVIAYFSINKQHGYTLWSDHGNLGRRWFRKFRCPGDRKNFAAARDHQQEKQKGRLRKPQPSNTSPSRLIS